MRKFSSFVKEGAPAFRPCAMGCDWPRFVNHRRTAARLPIILSVRCVSHKFPLLRTGFLLHSAAEACRRVFSSLQLPSPSDLKELPPKALKSEYLFQIVNSHYLKITRNMADQENKDFSEDIADQSFDQNGGENGGGDATENGPETEDDRSGSNQESLNDRKLFVGGLSWETTDKELRDHFGSYGDIESINVKTDPNTGRSRGFAFIVFAKGESLDKIMSIGEHMIHGKKVDPKKAKARHGKIFVGGLSTELSDDDIKNFFSQFGTIVDVEMPFDKTKNQRKGFCFITFESEAVVNELLKTPKQTINGKEVDVKKATPKPDGMGGMRGGPGARGARGGRGRGGRGGFGAQGGWGQGGGYGYGQGYGQGGYGGGYDGYSTYGDYYGGGYPYDYNGYGSLSHKSHNSSNHHSIKPRHFQPQDIQRRQRSQNNYSQDQKQQ